jgi:hypothetical protein
MGEGKSPSPIFLLSILNVFKRLINVTLMNFCHLKMVIKMYYLWFVYT